MVRLGDRIDVVEERVAAIEERVTVVEEGHTHPVPAIDVLNGQIEELRRRLGQLERQLKIGA